ncbi:MAG: hypothetical protein ACYDHX_10325 [Methanothrix sp.]
MQPGTIASIMGTILILAGLSVIMIIQIEQAVLSNPIQQPMDTIKFDVAIIYPDLILIGFGVLLLLKSMSRNY